MAETILLLWEHAFDTIFFFYLFFSSVSRNRYLPKVCLLDMRRENIQPPGEVKVEIVNCMDRIPELELTSPSSIRVRSVHFPINLCDLFSIFLV